jgi:hypothetical protein
VFGDEFADIRAGDSAGHSCRSEPRRTARVTAADLPRAFGRLLVECRKPRAIASSRSTPGSLCVRVVARARERYRVASSQDKEITRRTDGRRRPEPAALLLLAGALLIEAHDEWQVSYRRYLSAGSLGLLLPKPNTEEVTQPALIAS